MNKRKEFLPISIPDISDLEKNEIMESLESRRISTVPKIRKFEKLFAEYHNMKYAIALSSRRAALFLVAKCLHESELSVLPTFDKGSKMLFARNKILFGLDKGKMILIFRPSIERSRNRGCRESAGVWIDQPKSKDIG